MNLPFDRVDDLPKVSVVIPTIERNEVRLAIGSVLAQTYPQTLIEVVVVSDCLEPGLKLKESEFPSVRIIATGGKKLASYARNLGVREATGKIVAYLDDDDSWQSDHLEKMVSAYLEIDENLRAKTLFSSRANIRIASQESERSKVVISPSKTISKGELVRSYLFLSRKAGLDRNALFTPTLLIERKTALNFPWNPGLPRHQDWDWVTGLQENGHISQVVQISAATVNVTIGSTQSISGGSDWKSSLVWIRSKTHWEPQIICDFLTAQTLRYSLQARDLAGARRVIEAIIKTGRIPSFGPTLYALSGLLSRELVKKFFKRER